MSDRKIVIKNKQNLKFKNKINFKFKEKSAKLKNQKAILLAQIGILIFFGGYFAGLPASSAQNIDSFNPVGLFNSEYTVENLRGDTISLYKYWKIPQGAALTVNILNPVSMSSESIEIIKNTITSTETIEIKDSLLHTGQPGSTSTFYLGWKGALQATTETKIPIPKNFKIENSPKSDGDIIIILSNIRDRSGFSGYTKTILEGEQIIKSFITIYDVKSLSNNQLETIIRHEFGHALGLGHSTYTKDLMAPTIDMTYPFISQCNVMAISDLYNENAGKNTVCEK